MHVSFDSICGRLTAASYSLHRTAVQVEQNKFNPQIEELLVKFCGRENVGGSQKFLMDVWKDCWICVGGF